MNVTSVVSYEHPPGQESDKLEQLVCKVPGEVKQGHTLPSCSVSPYIITSLNGRPLRGTFVFVL